MPVYLLHGFRWARPLIRIHIILQNLEDAAAEWLCAPATTGCLIENFEELYPDQMQHLSDLRFIEQHDPDDLSPSAGSQPYAYVADFVQDIKLGLDVDDVRGKGLSNEQWSSILELRDKLAPAEKVGWYIVVCGDVERNFNGVEEEESEEEVVEVPVQNGHSRKTTRGAWYETPAPKEAFQHPPTSNGTSYSPALSKQTTKSPPMPSQPYYSPSIPGSRPHTSDGRSVRTISTSSVSPS